LSVILVTGAAGLIGSETVRLFSEKGFDVVGLDNDMRARFFGDEASTKWNLRRLQQTHPRFQNCDLDIRDQAGVDTLFQRYGRSIAMVVHAAAQPSHDWAARDPVTDFTVNANGTLVLLEATRRFCPDAVFVFTSTNKVYGDRPNFLPLEEYETRYEIAEQHPYFTHGIDEQMSLDQTRHSLFGASKVAADVLVQEYGRYFGLATGVFRGGCLTGPSHSGAQLHGFLAYLMKCAVSGSRYTVFGYKGKQVRDNIHSSDLVRMFWHFFAKPRAGEVYNAGGGRFSNCSMLEAIALCEGISGRKLDWSYSEDNRVGDHIWWISDTRKFQSHYPDWRPVVTLEGMLREICEEQQKRLQQGKATGSGRSSLPS
jgi:CDP-paratose 2-epimerase